MRGLTVAGALAFAQQCAGVVRSPGIRADTGLAGRLTAVPDRNPPSTPAGICTADRVPLLSASTVAEAPGVLLDQDITYLVH
jgi:hypothetical protein